MRPYASLLMMFVNLLALIGRFQRAEDAAIQVPHDVPEPRSADRTLGNQLSIVDNAEHAKGRWKLP
jgi:hypothetical protein